MKGKLAERGQVTIPQKIRKELGLKPGTMLDFHVEKGRLIAEKADQRDGVSAVYGCLRAMVGKRDTESIMRELRGDG